MSTKSRLEKVEQVLANKHGKHVLCVLFDNCRLTSGMSAGECKGLLAGMKTQDCDNCILVQQGYSVTRVVFHFTYPAQSRKEYF